jgi:hypothetical protein
MTVNVPTSDEFDALLETVAELGAVVGDLETRVAAIEAGSVTPPDPPDNPDAFPTPPIVIPPDVEPPDVEPPPAGTLQVVVQLAGQQYVFNEADGKDLSTYQDPDGRFSERCTRVTRTDTPLRCDFRRMEGRTSVVFGQGYWSDATHVNLPGYTALIKGDGLPDGVESVGIEVPSHAAYQRWRWCSAPWPFPMRKMAELYDAKLLPRFDPAITHGNVINYGYADYTPMGLAGLCGYMPQTGGRGDIGHVTSWQGWFICHEDDPQALATVLAQGEAGGTFTWDFCDPDSGAVIDAFEQYPQATLYNAQAGAPFITYSDASTAVGVTYIGPPGAVLSPNGSPPAWSYWWSSDGVQGRVPVDTRIPDSGSITIGWNEVFGSRAPAYGPGTIENGPAGCSCVVEEGTYITGSGITLDSAHQPACSYLPFLLTGDPYYLENLQRQCAFIVMENPSAPVRSYGVGQPRAAGWSARTLAQAAKVSPTSPPSWLLPKHLYIEAINHWADEYFYDETCGNPANHRAVLNLVSYGYMAGDDGTVTSVQGYQEDIAHGGLAWFALLHPGTQWDEIVHWNAQQTMARLDPDSGWSLGVPAPYFIKVLPGENQPAFYSWSECWAANEATFGPYSDTVPVPDAGSIDYYTHMSAGMAIAWQAGCVENRAALTRLLTAITTATAGGVAMDPNRAIAGPVS